MHRPIQNYIVGVVIASAGVYCVCIQVLCGDVVEDYTHAGLKGDVKLSASLWSCDPRLESHDYRMKSHDPWLQTWCDLLTEVEKRTVCNPSPTHPSPPSHLLLPSTQ